MGQNMSKFIYEKEGELQLGDSQCSFCMHNNEDQKNICVKFPTGKPQEIVNDQKLCPHLKSKGEVDLD